MKPTGKVFGLLVAVLMIGGTGAASAALPEPCLAHPEDPTGLTCLGDAYQLCADTYPTGTRDWLVCHTQATGEWLCPYGSQCRAIYRDIAGTCSTHEWCSEIRDLLPRP